MPFLRTRGPWRASDLNRRRIGERQVDKDTEEKDNALTYVRRGGKDESYIPIRKRARAGAKKRRVYVYVCVHATQKGRE